MVAHLLDETLQLLQGAVKGISVAVHSVREQGGQRRGVLRVSESGHGVLDGAHEVRPQHLDRPIERRDRRQ